MKLSSPSSLFSGLRKPEGMGAFTPRRFYYFVGIWLAIATLLVIGNQFLADSRLTAGWRLPFVTDDGTIALPTWSTRNTHKGKLRVAILEAAGVHDEVKSALYHSFGGQHDVELVVYQKKQRYNMSAIVDEFDLASPIQNITHIGDFIEDVPKHPPHIVVSTTCEMDTRFRKSTFDTLLKDSNTYLFCLFHHGDHWVSGDNVDVIKRWAAQSRVDMIALSEHTAEFLKKYSLPTWGNGENVRVRVLPPIFPVDAPGPESTTSLNLAMQGDFSSKRRDYQGIFQGLVNVREKIESLPSVDNVTLHLLGHGEKPQVPENVRDRVVFDTSLSYPRFYSLISEAYAVLPAFATGEYYDRKASSTVPASIIAGAPIVATEQLLQAYTYLPREAAWVIKEGETEMEAVQRVIGDQAEFEQKRAFIADLRERLLKENIENVYSWIVEALKRMA